MALHNPYVGPRPFTEEEERFFFGRAEETEVLTSLVVARRASLLFAQSGAGKSSLLMAGLAPRLLRHTRVSRGRTIQERLVSGIRVARVGKGQEELQPANIFVQSVAISLARDPSSVPAPGITLEHVLEELLASAVDGVDEDGSTLPFLLVFDQFEELFTRHQLRRQDRVDFFRQVADALRAHDELRVLFSMREDYIAELVPFAHLLPDALRPRYRLERLGLQASIDAVRKPAALSESPRVFAEGVPEALCANLQSKTSGEIEAILLQVVCNRLWTNLAEDTREIGHDDLQTAGNVDDALRAYYDDAVATVVTALAGTETTVSERRVRRLFSQQLITPARTRALVFRDDASGFTGGLPNAVMDVLSGSTVNIVRSEVRSGGRWYELSHDRLIAPVIASNDAWDAANVTLLQKRAREWSRLRRDDDLLRRLELLEIESQIAGAPSDPLTPLEDEFLTRSRQALATATASLRVNVGELGWAVVFAEDDPDRMAIAEALAPLLEHRREQTKARFSRFAFDVVAGETAQSFLARNGASTRPGASGEPMPYYLLIVGSPERIPFEFQYGLDTHYAVGRLYFEGTDSLETLLMYARYARSVVDAESGRWALRREAVIFNPVPEGDTASVAAHQTLVTPLLEGLRRPDVAPEGWETTPVVKELATRDRLLRLLGGSHRPSLLVAVAHGLSFPMDKPERQYDEQGAILCADWSALTTVDPSMYVSARDIDQSATLLGMIVFMAVPYGAGTPEFAVPMGGKRHQNAARDFVSRLAQRLLSHPNGGALAVIGNVDTFWSWIFEQFDESSSGQRWRSEGPATWLNALIRLMRGHTAGSAMEPFNTRYTQAASDLVDTILSGTSTEDRATQRLMLEAVSVRNYIVLGDPAVRLPVDGPIPEQRPMIDVRPEEVQGIAARADQHELPLNMETTRKVVLMRRLQLETRPAAPLPTTRMAVFNGIDLNTGEYANAPISAEALASLAVSRPEDESRPMDDSYLAEGASYFERPSSES
jgi:hypothetical protein